MNKQLKDRLQVGQVLSYEGRIWRVGLVNDSRARLDPLTGSVTMVDPTSGRSFNSYGNSVNVSPNSVLGVAGFDLVNPETLDGTALARYIRMEEADETSTGAGRMTSEQGALDYETEERPTAADFSDGVLVAPMADFEEVHMAASGVAAMPVRPTSKNKAANKARLDSLKAKKAAKQVGRTKAAPKGDNRCKCGCNGKTGGNFVPGHDARFKGLMLKVERGEIAKEKAFPKAVIDSYSWVSTGIKGEVGTGQRTTKNYKGEPHSGYASK